MSQFSVVINAGGKSARMGSDKAFADLGGKPMIERIIEQTAGLGEQIIIANDKERYSQFGLPVVSDLLPDKGALGGLYTAIHTISQPYAIVLACDMPLVNRPLLEYMMGLAPEFDAVVPHIIPNHTLPLDLRGLKDRAGLEEKPEAEPFRAIYGKTCLEPIRKALEAGRMRMVSFYGDIKLRWVEENEIKQYDPELLTFKNCNTPEELQEVREIWEMREASNKRQTKNVL